MRLSPFRAEDAADVAGWSSDPVEVLRWCGHPVAPVPVETIVSWSAGDDVLAYTMSDADGQVIAYGELWLDEDEQEVELARLIVAPSRRGQGVGRTFVTELAGLARAHYEDVFLRVHPANTAALRCYAGAGFAPVPDALREEWNAHQPVPYMWLRAG